MGWRERLREAVDATGLRHSEIARRAGVSHESLSRILNGRQKPSFEIVVRIAHACGETVGWVTEQPGYDLSRVERMQLHELARFLDRMLTRLSRVDSLKHPNAIPEDDDIPPHARRDGARLCFRAIGDSMLDAIQPGDVLYVRPEASWKRANACVALVEIHGKHYAKTLTVDGEILTLTSAAEGHTEITVSRRDPAVQLVGVVVARAGFL